MLTEEQIIFMRDSIGTAIKVAAAEGLSDSQMKVIRAKFDLLTRILQG